MHVVTVDDSSLLQRGLPIIFAAVAHLARNPGRNWWKEPRQYTHYDVIEGDVWHHDPEFRDAKYKDAYRMNFMSFQFLVSEIEPWITSQALMFVREPLPIHKAVGLVIYRLAHGYSTTFMTDRFCVGASTIRKYMDIIVDVLSDEKKLFARYISIPRGQRLQDIIQRFQYVCGLPNVAGSIDGTHIPLAEKPSMRDTSVPADFYCARKGFNSVVLQAVCDADKLFWNVCCNMPGGTADGGAFQSSSLYDQLRAREIFQEPVVIVQGHEVRPYLLADSAYPLREYMLRNFKPPDGDPDKQRFDKQMNSGRIVIENAFGLLKGRWRILKSARCSIKKLPKIVSACCVLHNFCQLMGEAPPGGRPNVNVDPDVGLLRQRHPHREGRGASLAGEALRNALFADFMSMVE